MARSYRQCGGLSACEFTTFYEFLPPFDTRRGAIGYVVGCPVIDARR